MGMSTGAGLVHTTGGSQVQRGAGGGNGSGGAGSGDSASAVGNNRVVWSFDEIDSEATEQWVSSLEGNVQIYTL